MLGWTRAWKLMGWDTFAGESYRIGRYFTESGARRAARRYLRRLKKIQPIESSGGQAPDGMQDSVFIVRPDDSEYPFAP